MNPRIEKLKEERDKTARKIEILQSRLKSLDEQILRLENTDIVGIVREKGLSIDQLAELVALLDNNPIPRIPTEYTETEDICENED